MEGLANYCAVTRSLSMCKGPPIQFANRKSKELHVVRQKAGESCFGTLGFVEMEATKTFVLQPCSSCADDQFD